MAVIVGTLLCHGCKPEYATMPITNLPAGTIKVRRRFRNDREAEAFVKTERTIQKWFLEPDGNGALRLSLLRGVNVIS